MKSYDETIASVFDKIQTHRAKQKRKKQIVLSAVVPVCLMAVFVAGIWMYQSGDRQDYTLNAPTIPVSMDSVNETIEKIPIQTDSPAVPTEHQDKIIIHSVDVPENRMDIAIWWDDYIIMTLEEITEYYGTDIVPTIPDDLCRWEDETYGVYKRNKGSGEIYWDQNIQHFTNEDSTREIYVETAKGALPFHCCVIYGTEKEYSIINGVEVAIGQNSDGIYSVWFMYQNTGFYICAMGVTEDELVNVIRSLTD